MAELAVCGERDGFGRYKCEAYMYVAVSLYCFPAQHLFPPRIHTTSRTDGQTDRQTDEHIQTKQQQQQCRPA